MKQKEGDEMSAPIPEDLREQYEYAARSNSAFPGETAREWIERIAALEAQIEALPANWFKDSSLQVWFPFTAEELSSLKVKVAALEAQVATAIAMRDLEERNKIDFIQQLERSEAQNRQLREALTRYRERHRQYSDRPRTMCIEYDGELGYPDNRCLNCRIADAALAATEPKP